MLRLVIIILIIICCIGNADGRGRNTVVADSATHKPLPGAAVFDRRGNYIGLSHSSGRIPYISTECYPVRVRYLGYREKNIQNADADTVFLQENISELPEVVVGSRRDKILHMLAYVREYSTLTTYTDTVFLFREKMVDYMLNSDRKIKFKGWTNPRVLKSRSYYRFTDAQGLDSVSDASNHHFSWSDWIGVVPAKMPLSLKDSGCGSDTIRGKYSPTETWTRRDDRVSVDVNVLADTASRRWVPDLSGFFRGNLDFENFRIRFNFDNADGDSISPADLSDYSFSIESAGRGREMFGFNRIDEPFFVSTYAEVYILDKEYITLKEAKKWDSDKLRLDGIEIFEPAGIPDLQPSVMSLVDRVKSIDKDRIRQSLPPDYRLAGNRDQSRNFRIGHRALMLLKQLTGISLYRSRRNFDRQWERFRQTGK